MSDPDGQIEDLAALYAGDHAAWSRFVDRYAPVIYAAIRRGLGSRADAATRDDVAQAVFIRLYANDRRALRGFDPGRARLSTWLTVVAYRVALSQVRGQRRGVVSLAVAARLTAPEPAAPDLDDQRPRDLPTEILPPQQRQVVDLIFGRGLSVAETAIELGIEEQTVRSAKHKALNHLRTHLERRGRRLGMDVRDDA